MKIAILGYENKINVVTANKDMLAEYGNYLLWGKEQEKSLQEVLFMDML